MSKNQPFWSRLRFALDGLGYSLRTERSMQVHALALTLVVVLMLVLEPSAEWWALVALACAAVVTAELINTAIERLSDHLHPGQHPSIRIVKDCAAAAVLISSAGAVAVAIALAVHVWQSHQV